MPEGRGMYFIEPEDNEFKEIIKNAQKELEVPAVLAMPCKRTNRRHGATRCKNDDHKSKNACILGAKESKWLRMRRLAPKIHEDHIAGKASNSLHHYNLVHKFIPMPQAMKIPAAKAAVDRELGKTWKHFGMESGESQKQIWGDRWSKK